MDARDKFTFRLLKKVIRIRTRADRMIMQARRSCSSVSREPDPSISCRSKINALGVIASLQSPCSVWLPADIHTKFTVA
jgi:hypothetical protein